MMKKGIRRMMFLALIVFFCAESPAAPVRRPAVKRAVRTAPARRNISHVPPPKYRRYYWWYDDDCHHHDYVNSATCILKVRRILSNTSALFEVKCSIGYVSVDRRDVKTGIDYTLREKQIIRVDGIDIQNRHTGDAVYLPSSKNLWFNGEYRDPHGKNYQCYTLRAEDAVAFNVNEN